MTRLLAALLVVLALSLVVGATVVLSTAVLPYHWSSTASSAPAPVVVELP